MMRWEKSVLQSLGLLARWCTLVLLCLGAGAQAQSDVLPVPALATRITDQTGTLNAGQLQALGTKLASFESDHGTQIVVLMVNTTAPEDIASYANRVANTWKVGRKDIGDGLLLVVAKGDRKLRIEVAKTLEGAVPDLAAKRVIDQAITPRFKQGDFAGGIDAGLEQLMTLVHKEALPTPPNAGEQGPKDVVFADVAWKVGFWYLGIFVLAVFLGGVTGFVVVFLCELSGTMVGLVTWIITHAPGATFWGAMGGMVGGIGLLFLIDMLFGDKGQAGSARVSKPTQAPKRADVVAAVADAQPSGEASVQPVKVTEHGSKGDSWWSSITSGGGGDFGGGGASGDW